MAKAQSEDKGTRSMISQTIHVLRFPMLILIVLIHCNLSYKSHGSLGNHDIANSIMYFISECLCRGCVPLYFAISGYLFFQGMVNFRWDFFTHKWHKRTKTLLRPYILWNFIGFLVILLIHSNMLKSFFPGLPPVEVNFTYFLKCFWKVSDQYKFFEPAGSPADSTMWFLRDLMVLNLLSPLIYILLRRIGKIFIALVLLCFFCGIWVRITSLSITGVLFYSIGAYVSLRKLKVLPAMLSWHFLPVITVLWCLFDTVAHTSMWYQQIHAMTILLTFLTLIYCGGRYAISTRSSYIIGHPILNQLGFFIFAMHYFITPETKTAICRMILPQTDIGWILCYILSMCALVGIPALIFFILRKVSPVLINWMTGK